MTPGGIFDAFEAEITTWGRADLKDVDDSNLVLKVHLQRSLKLLIRYVKVQARRLLLIQKRQLATSWQIKEKHVI